MPFERAGLYLQTRHDNQTAAMFSKLFKKSPKTEPVKPQHSASQRAKLPDGFLQKLIPIGDLPPQELQALPIFVRRLQTGDVLFRSGDPVDALVYLLSGEIYLENNNGNGYSVEASLFKACYPLSGQQRQLFTAIAKTACEIVQIAAPKPSTTPTAPVIRKPSQALADSPLYQAFQETLQSGRLHVPSLPDVALRLRRALQQDISIGEAAKIVSLEPRIAAKLIQMANSPIYAASQPITQCPDAIHRLGLKTTQNLVTSISLNHLFQSKNPRLHSLVQQLWKQSIHVASLSYALAALNRKVSPDEALLAGLVHNLGALPIVAFATTLDNALYSEQQLLDLIAQMQGLTGDRILQAWNFPEHLQSIPGQTCQWYFDGGPELQLGDIVILARFHYLLSQGKTAHLPPLNSLPAFAKLGETSLTPDLSLQILNDARQQVSEALSFFNL
jgi:HD-like signal output (HDOD) protein